MKNEPLFAHYTFAQPSVETESSHCVSCLQIGHNHNLISIMTSCGSQTTSIHTYLAKGYKKASMHAHCGLLLLLLSCLPVIGSLYFSFVLFVCARARLAQLWKPYSLRV